MKSLPWFSKLSFCILGILSIAAKPGFAKDSSEEPMAGQEYMDIPDYGTAFGGAAFGDSPYSSDFTSEWGNDDAFKPEADDANEESPSVAKPKASPQADKEE